MKRVFKKFIYTSSPNEPNPFGEKKAKVVKCFARPTDWKHAWIAKIYSNIKVSMAEELFKDHLNDVTEHTWEITIVVEE